jgi:hypothetical protein
MKIRAAITGFLLLILAAASASGDDKTKTDDKSGRADNPTASTAANISSPAIPAAPSADPQIIPGGGGGGSGIASAVRKGASLPATCTVGQVFMDTSTSPAVQYWCYTTDVWTSGSGGGGGVTCAACTLNFIPAFDGTNLINSHLSDSGVSFSATEGMAISGSLNVGGLNPTAPVPSVVPTGGVGSTWTYKISMYDVNNVETACGASGTTVVGAATLDGTHYNQINWATVGGAPPNGYNVYRTAHGASPANNGLVGGAVSGSPLTFRDTGFAADTTRQCPTVNATGGLGLDQFGAVQWSDGAGGKQISLQPVVDGFGVNALQIFPASVNARQTLWVGNAFNGFANAGTGAQCLGVATSFAEPQWCATSTGATFQMTNATQWTSTATLDALASASNWFISNGGGTSTTTLDGNHVIIPGGVKLDAGQTVQISKDAVAGYVAIGNSTLGDFSLGVHLTNLKFGDGTIQTTASAGGSIPTGTGFTHITSGTQDGASKTVDVSSADITGVLKAAAFPALTGDATTSAGALATTVVKVNGVAFASSPATDTTPVTTAANTATYTALPNCTDTGGNHLNYTTSSHLFSCGTSGGGGGGSTTGNAVIGFSGSALSLAATFFTPYDGGGLTSTTEANVDGSAPKAATVSNLFVQLSAPPGAATSIAITLRDTTANTALTCTIANTATSCSDTAHSVSVAQGDLIDWQIVPTGVIAATPNLIIMANWLSPGPPVVSGGSIYPTFTAPPLAAAWTCNTCTGVTLVDDTVMGSLVVRLTTAAVSVRRVLGQTAALPATPYTQDACVIPAYATTSANSTNFGLGIFPSATTPSTVGVSIDIGTANTTGPTASYWRWVTWVDTATENGVVTPGPTTIVIPSLLCMRITNDGATINNYLSTDSKHWTKMSTGVANITSSHAALLFGWPQATQSDATWVVRHFAIASTVCTQDQNIAAGACAS